jgi:hypothetical protein
LGILVFIATFLVSFHLPDNQSKSPGWIFQETVMHFIS